MYYDQDGHNKTYASPTCTIGCFFHPCIRLKTIEQFKQIFYTANFLTFVLKYMYCLFVYADICIEFVAGRINAEILYQKLEFKPTRNCPKCKTDKKCSKCCDGLVPPLYGVPVCRNYTHCVCSIHSTVPNNISSLTPPIAN
jgi:hypothetical protein